MNVWPVNVFLWDAFSLFPDTPQRSKFYYQEQTSKKKKTHQDKAYAESQHCLHLTDSRLRHWPFTGAKSAPKDGTENKAILVIATQPLCDFEAFLQQHRHCCADWEKQSCLTPVSNASCYNTGLKENGSKRLWNNLHIYILPVRQLTYGLN